MTEGWALRGRHQRQDVQRDRAEQLRRDLSAVRSRSLDALRIRHHRIAGCIALKLRPASSVRIAAERVVYRAQAGRQIAVAKRVGGYGDLVELPADVANVKNIRDEKGLVFNHR